jgi:hypothetical protein
LRPRRSDSSETSSYRKPDLENCKRYD